MTKTTAGKQQEALDVGDDAETVEPESANLPATIESSAPERMPTDADVIPLIKTDDAWADVDDGDMTPSAGRIPYLALNRNLEGGFTDPDTGEITKELTFIWLAKGLSRAWFKDPFGKGESAPSCRSADGRRADEESPAQQEDFDPGTYDGPLPHPEGDCANCPLSKWHGKEKPACGESIEALVFLPDPLGFGRLSRLRWSGIAVGPARAYWDSFTTRLPKRPPIAYQSLVTLEPKNTDFGPKLAPRFERVAEISRAQAQPLIEERDRRLADWKADIADDMATAAASDVHDTQSDGPFDGEPASGSPAEGEAFGESTEPF